MGSAPGRSERCSVWAIVRSRSYSWALEIATEASWASWVRIVSSRAVNSRSRRSTISSIPSSLPRAVRCTDSRAGCGSPVGQLRRRRRGQRPQPRVGRVDRHGRPVAAEQRAGGVGGQLEDLLDGQRRVERDRDVGQRPQLLDVLVLDAGDLAHLAVAAMHALEHRQALAQEVGGRLQRLLRRPAGSSAARTASWCASARSSTLMRAATAWRPRSYAAPSSRSLPSVRYAAKALAYSAARSGAPFEPPSDTAPTAYGVRR